MDNDGNKPTTTDAGIPVASDEHSLTVGPDGPILLQDHYLIEQMANFNRERTPERQPHAKGGGAFGRFEVTMDVSKYTKAALFQPGVKTDMLARFSTGASLRQKSRAHNDDGVDRRDGTRAVLISSMMRRVRAAAASGRNDRRLGLSQGVRKLLVQVQVHFQKIARRQRQPLIQ
jgi:hypothetical protein